MASSSTPYQRLTGNAASYATYSSLWLGDDHLVIVRSTGYQESYTRLQLNEVKGIFLSATKRRLGWGIFWGVVFGLSLLPLVLALRAGETPVFSVFFAFIGLTGLTWNHLLGPTCKAHVVTGVQTAELPALIRFKKSRRVIARLQPLIAELQAGLIAVPPPVMAAASPGEGGGAAVANVGGALPFAPTPGPNADPQPPAVR